MNKRTSMQTNPRRGVWLLSILAILTTLLAACGSPSTQTPAASEAGDSAAQPAAAGKPVTLKWFLRWDKARLDSVAQPVVEAFQKEHPNITIQIENIGSGAEYWTKLQTMVASGGAPDVVYPATHNLYALASKGALLNLDPLIERDGLDTSVYEQEILDLYRYDGNLYGLPVDTASLVVFYNKKMFDEAGVAYPEAGWTWEQFREAAIQLTQDSDGDGRIDQYGVDTFTEYWPVVVWTMAGHGLFDDIRTPSAFQLNDPKAVEAVQWLADLSAGDQKVMPTVDERGDISDLFVAGKSAMKIIGHWRVPQYMENISDFEWDVAPLPMGEQAANRADGSAFAVSAQTQHPEEAWEFVKFLAGPGSYGVGLLLDLQQMTPVLAEFRQSDAFLKPEKLPGVHKQAFLAGTENLYPMYDPIHPVYDELNAIILQELAEVWNGNTTAQEAIDRMTPQVEAVLQTVE